MAAVYSSRTCLLKFICSILVVGLFIAGVLITGAYPHKDISNPLFQADNNTGSNTTKYNTYPNQDSASSSTQLEAIQPATKRCKHTWNKLWKKSNKTCKETRNSLKESQNHPEQSKQFRPWKQQLPYSGKTTQNQNTRLQNMPPETNARSAHQVCTRCPSRIYSNTTSRTITTPTGSLETKWRRSSNKIQTCLRKFPRPIRHRRKNSRRTPSWPWSPRRWPRTCSSNTTTGFKDTLARKISPRGENHFSKRRSENDNKSRSKESKSESESESKDTKRESENKDIRTIMTDSKTEEAKRLQHNVTAKTDKVKAIKITENK
jgi:hypothetical protein